MENSKYQQKRIFVINNPFAPRLCPELALEIGLNESIILLQLEFWISIGGHEKDGKRWVYKSIENFRKEFPFWSRETINRTLHKLERKELIEVTTRYNEKRYDYTRWICLNLKKIVELKSVNVANLSNSEAYMKTPVNMESGQNETRSSQNETRSSQNETRSSQNETRSSHFETTIPETNTEIYTETTTEINTPPTPQKGERSVSKNSEKQKMKSSLSKRIGRIPNEWDLGLAEIWNKHAPKYKLSPVEVSPDRYMGKERSELLTAARQFEPDLENWERALSEVSGQPWLTGDCENSNWKMSFDWFVNPSNMVKVRDRAYSAKKKVKEDYSGAGVSSRIRKDQHFDRTNGDYLVDLVEVETEKIIFRKRSKDQGKTWVIEFDLRKNGNENGSRKN